MHLTLGIFLLLGFIILIYLGFMHRVLHRMYLSPKGALFIIAAIILGSFLPEIPLYGAYRVNIGGGVIPLAVVIYILLRSGSKREQVRSLMVAVLVSLTIYLTDQYLPVEPGLLGYDLDPIFLPAPIAAISAYLLGRSRRAAFCGAILGVIGADLLTRTGGFTLGGGGLFDTIVISGLLAVLITEFFGELLERLNHLKGS